ncbi:MAG: Na(+)/H(+) antiporter NhaA, partial [Deltaproteobacteria bacterium]
MTRWLRNFLGLDAAPGILLIAMAVLAMALANSPLAWLYDALLATPVEIRVGPLHLAKPLLL